MHVHAVCMCNMPIHAYVGTSTIATYLQTIQPFPAHNAGLHNEYAETKMTLFSSLGTYEQTNGTVY